MILTHTKNYASGILRFRTVPDVSFLVGAKAVFRVIKPEVRRLLVSHPNSPPCSFRANLQGGQRYLVYRKDYLRDSS